MKPYMPVAILALLLSLNACAEEAMPPGWVKHSDPAGFVVSHPKGWNVTASADGLIVIESAAKSAKVVVQPFFLQKPMTAEEWIAQVPKLLGGVFPKAQLDSTKPRQKRPDEMFASIRYAAGGKAGKANALCSIDGSSGMLYVVAAPEADFAAQKATLVKVLKSFSFTAPAASWKAPAAPGAVEWVRWKDPKQDAFSLEVPRDWNVTGGMFHRNAVDPRAVVVAASRDGQIVITGGDVDVPTFTLPTPTLAAAGFTEGSPYSPGYGVVMQVSRHMPGAAFPKWYVTSKLPKGYAGLTFIDARDRDDTVKLINEVYAQNQNFGITSKLSAGEVAFTCKKDAQLWNGYYFASTRLTEGLAGGGGIWNMESLYGYMAVAGKEKDAQTILAGMLKSFQLNPEWVAKQQNLTAEVSKIVTKTNDEISKAISDTYWNREKARDDMSRKWSNMMLGQTDVADPGTGEKWKVSNGHNYYWRKDHAGVVVGTDTYERPDTDFTPLEEW